MLKLTGGAHKGRSLKWLDSPTIRPTPARVREAVFNILSADNIGSRWWDLCCGSGVVGIEALSRGAERVRFVDSNRRSLQLVKDNLRTFGLQPQSDVVCQDVVHWLRRQHSLDADFVYFDPPYDSKIYQLMLDELGALPLGPSINSVRLIVEYRRRHQRFELPASWDLYDEREYGDTCLAILIRERDVELDPDLETDLETDLEPELDSVLDHEPEPELT